MPRIFLVSIGLMFFVSCGSVPAAQVVTRAAATNVSSASTSPPTTEPTAVPPTAALTPDTSNKVWNIGDRIEDQDMALSVLSAEQKSAVGTIFTAKEGNVYVVLDVLIENTGTEKIPYNLLYFKIKDQEGFEYDTKITDDEKALGSGELAAGEKVRGHVVFEVKQGLTDLVMQYKPVLIGATPDIKVLIPLK